MSSYKMGDRVQVNAPDSQRYGLKGTVIGPSAWPSYVRVQLDNGGGVWVSQVNQLSPIAPVQQQPKPPRFKAGDPAMVVIDKARDASGFVWVKDARTSGKSYPVDDGALQPMPSRSLVDAKVLEARRR